MKSSQRNVECPLCGNNDYTLKDGHYYCTLCQTQSQNVVEIDYGEAVGGLAGAVTPGRRPMAEKKTKKKEEREEVVLPPYALYEAYAVIFERLGSMLFRLGLPETIREALFRLYALYLRRRGVAFLDTNETNDADSGAIAFRSKFLHVMKQHNSGKQSQTADIKLELDDFYSNNDQNNRTSFVYLDVLGGTSTNADQVNPSSTLVAGERETGQSVASSAPAKGRRKRKISECITLGDSDDEVHDENDEYSQNVVVATRIQPNMIIPFCYLACLAVSPQKVFMSDLLRWMKENLLPVVDAYDLLPERLKHPLIRNHFARSWWAPRSNVTSVFYRRALWLANYIRYSPTINFDVDLLLARFAYDLNLSKHFLPRARVIIRAAKVVDCTFRFSPLDDENLRSARGPATPPEVAAVAVLIVALKLTFGLDDHCEYIISQLADESGESEELASNFSFCRWQQQCRLRSAIAEGESIEHVLSRQWIDQRETWMYGLISELEYVVESNHRHAGNARTGRKAYEIENEIEKEGEGQTGDSADVNVDGLRRLFGKFTPFQPSRGPPSVETRQPFYPLRETVDLLERNSKSSYSKDFDLNNMSIFEHDFFKDSLSFLSRHAVKKRIKQMIQALASTVPEEKIKLNPFEKLFPCARSISRASEIIADSCEKNEHFRISNVMENENEYEISSNLAWLLKMCKSRLQEDMFVLFRAVQRIEASLDEDLKKSSRVANILDVL